MDYKLIFFAGMLIVLATLNGSVRADVSEDTFKNIVDKYLVARQATLLQTATSADVDKLLAFYTDDIIYEHPRVKMRIEGKNKIREGMLRFLGKSKDAKVVTINRISGVDIVVAKYRVAFKAQEGSGWKNVSRVQVTLFEFEGNKIKRLVDYW